METKLIQNTNSTIPGNLMPFASLASIACLNTIPSNVKLSGTWDDDDDWPTIIPVPGNLPIIIPKFAGPEEKNTRTESDEDDDWPTIIPVPGNFPIIIPKFKTGNKKTVFSRLNKVQEDLIPKISVPYQLQATSFNKNDQASDVLKNMMTFTTVKDKSVDFRPKLKNRKRKVKVLN